MKTCNLTPPGALPPRPRPAILFAVRLALGGLACAGLVTAASAATFIKADNTTALNLPGSYTANSGAPGAADTIQVDNTLTAGRSAVLGDNLAVYGITQTGVPGVNSNAFALTISATTGKALTLGAGGITKNAGNTSLYINCALALGTSQTWNLNSPTTSYLQLAGPSFADNGNTLTVNGIGRFDLNNGIAITYGPNVAINCAQLTINNVADDITLGGANGFTNLLVNQGIVEGTSFPASTAAGTTSTFGTGNGGTITLGGSSTSGTLIYNGNTAATPKSFTFDCRNSGGDTIKVSTAGQTLSLTNLLYANGTLQAADRNWNFGGAGNLAIYGPIKPSGSAAYKIGINKTDAGTLTLGATNTYTGNTYINGGTLALTGNGSISNSALIALASGTKFDVSGRSATFVLQPGQAVSNSPAALATLAGNLNASSGTLVITFNPGTAPLAITGGALTLSAGTIFNLTSLTPRLTAGVAYPLITAGTGGSVTGSLPAVALTGATGHLVINSNKGLDLVVDSATYAGFEPLHWAGSGSGTWDAADTGNIVWQDSTTPTALAVYYVDGDLVNFDEQYISGNQTVTLNAPVSPSGTVVANTAYSYTINGTGAISGSGGLAKLGTNVLTLAVANTYTGGTVISNGILKLGNATALGASGATVNVKSGAVLDMSGTTMTSANTNLLTLNGAGPAGGGALINSSASAANFFGPIALGSASTIAASGGALTLGSGALDPITGNYPLTILGPNQVDAFGNIQVASVTVNGSFRIESANTFAGGLTIKSGNAVAKNGTACGTGTVYLLDTAGSSPAVLDLGTSSVFNNPLVVQAGGTGAARMDTYGGYNPIWAGPITLNNALTLQAQYNGGCTLTVSGPIGGTGALTIGNSYAVDTVVLSGTNTYSGATYVTVGKLALTGNGSIANTAGITVSGGATLDVTGTTSGAYTLTPGQTLGSTGGTANLNGNFNASSGALAVSFDGATPVFAVNGSLTLAAGTAFSVNPTAGVLAAGTYNLIAAGVAGTAPAAVTLARGVGHLVINGGGGLDLVVTGTSTVVEPLHWAGSGAGTWDVGDATNVIWKDSTTPAALATFFVGGDTAAFDDLYINTNQVVTLNATMTAPGLLVSNATHNYTLAGPGTIGGSTPLTKAGNSNLVLQCGLNTTGELALNGGTIQLVSGSAWTVGGLSGSGGTLNVTTNLLTVKLTGQTETYSGTIKGYFPASAGAIGTGLFGLQANNSGTLILNGTINLAADNGTFASSAWSHIGPFNTAEMDLAGTTLMTNVAIRGNSTSVVRINGGTHTLVSPYNSCGFLLQDSAQFFVEGGTVILPAVQIGFGGATSATGPTLTIDGGSVTVMGTNGVQIGNNVTVATTASLNLNGGVLTTAVITDGGTNITTSGNNVINFNGGKLVCGGTNVFPNDFGYNGVNPVQLMVGDGGAVIDTAGYDNTLILPLENNGAGGLTKLGLGTLTLTNVNNYQGATVVSNGTLLVNGALDPASSVTVTAGGTLGGSGTIGGAVAYNAGAHAVFAPGTPLTISGSLTVATAGPLPDVHLVLSNNVPLGTYPLATYDGGAGVFSSTPVIDSGSLAPQTAATIVTGGGTVSLQVTASLAPNPARITYSVNGNTLTLNWPSGQGWQLQVNSTGLSNAGAWQTVAGATPPYAITNNPAQKAVFYRLKY